MSEQKSKFNYAYSAFPKISDKIVKFATEHIPKEHLLNDVAVRTDSIERDSHITVIFKIEDRMPSEWLFNECRKLGVFSVELGDVHVFEQREKKFDDGSKHSYDVVVVDVQDTEGKMLKLHKLWAQEYGIDLNKEDYPYKPHLTISYQVAGTGTKTAETAKGLGLFKGQKLEFSMIVVKEFRGSKIPKYFVSLVNPYSTSC